MRSSTYIITAHASYLAMEKAMGGPAMESLEFGRIKCKKQGRIGPFVAMCGFAVVAFGRVRM